jgi:hypothetical protein
VRIARRFPGTDHRGGAGGWSEYYCKHRVIKMKF